MARSTVDPITRIEGHLGIEMEVEDGRVSEAWASGGLFRGMEHALRGRTPYDAALVAQRICGVCPVSHAHASAMAAEQALGIQIPEGARLVRNIAEGAQILHSTILWFSANPNGEAETVRISFVPKPKLKKSSDEYDFSKLLIKGRASRGNLVSKNAIRKITLKSKGISTIGGKDIWFDEDINRLNEDGRGRYLGQFGSEDHILAIFKDGTYYTTSFDLSNRYQGELLRLEKFDPGKTWTAIYHFGGKQDSIYIKRFSFETSDNTTRTFISDEKGSWLVDISDDRHPQIEIVFGGKHEHREAEKIDAELFIAKKGLQAKGKKASPYEVKEAMFIEPIVRPEDEIEEAPAEPVMTDGSGKAEDLPEMPDMDYTDPEEDDGQLSLF